MSDAIKCPKCGPSHKVPQESNFCNHCGTRVVKQQAQEQTITGNNRTSGKGPPPPVTHFSDARNEPRLFADENSSKKQNTQGM